MSYLVLYGPTIGLLFLAVFAVSLVTSWQRHHPKFDLSDILTGDNGRVSLSKLGEASALVVSTWGFVVLTQQGKLSESYFIGYMTVWTGARILKAKIESKSNEPTSPNS
jgi:ABC-type Mn2+/Zn2+ transport system permease subunit